MKKFIFILAVIFLVGATVFASAKTIESLTATVVDFKISVDWEDKKLDLPIVVIDDRTYVPLKEAAEVLGYNTVWHEGQKKINLYTRPKQNRLVYANLFDFDGDGSDELLTVRKTRIGINDSVLCEIWNTDNGATNKIWTYEVAIWSEGWQSFAVQKFENKAYFCYSSGPGGEGGYGRNDDFYTMVNKRIEKVVNTSAKWGLADINPQKYFYINGVSITEQKYRDELKKFGLESEIIHCIRYYSSNPYEWDEAKINFNNPIDIYESVNYAPHIVAE